MKIAIETFLIIGIVISALHLANVVGLI